jgi:hypothetical protein
MKHLRLTIDDLRLKKRLLGMGFNSQSSIVNRQYAIAVLGFILLVLVGLWAQERESELPRQESKFTWSRIFYNFPMTRFWPGPVGAGNGPPWSHDWPRSEEHFMKIMSEVTKLDVNPGGHIISFQNDDCFKYPIAYLCEVGYMDLSKEEAHRMAEYLLRGGFLVVDDFRGPREFYNFQNQMKLVFPNRALEELPRTHEIWKCFYDISKLEIPPPPIYSRFDKPQYFGISDDNGRLMMVVDYNNDISEYWEWSDNPLKPIDETNEAYKYGVNYVMYALTH